MAEDIAIVWDNFLSRGDLEFKNGDLKRENGLTTAVMMSIFTDRRDESAEDQTDKRGWWGDLTTTDDEIGSRLWRLERASITQNNLNLTKIYLEECLQWMVDDKVCTDITVTIERNGIDKVFALIQITKGDGETFDIKFNDLWSAQFETT